jgi:hypothetical protein
LITNGNAASYENFAESTAGAWYSELIEVAGKLVKYETVTHDRCSFFYGFKITILYHGGTVKLK